MYIYLASNSNMTIVIDEDSEAEISDIEFNTHDPGIDNFSYVIIFLEGSRVQ